MRLMLTRAAWEIGGSQPCIARILVAQRHHGGAGIDQNFDVAAVNRSGGDEVAARIGLELGCRHELRLNLRLIGDRLYSPREQQQQSGDKRCEIGSTHDKVLSSSLMAGC
jgi:hypothetical protein